MHGQGTTVRIVPHSNPLTWQRDYFHTRRSAGLSLSYTGSHGHGRVRVGL
jgi:hypothetical protein